MLYVDEDTARQARESAVTDQPWWLSPYGAWRLAAETEAMNRHFPDFAPFTPPYARGWTGRLQSGMPPFQSYLVRITYPPSYPDDAPEVAILEPELKQRTPHLLGGQRPCLSRRGAQGWEPASTTVATLVGWLALWLHAYETYCETGIWPGAGE